jgi:hypothetical protein
MSCTYLSCVESQVDTEESKAHNDNITAIFPGIGHYATIQSMKKAKCEIYNDTRGNIKYAQNSAF